MDIAAFFRGDRFRLVSGIACETPENAHRCRHKLCPAWWMRRADSLWPAIVARPGNDRLATQDKEQMDITPLFRSDRCTVVLPKSFEIPWEFEQWSRTGKKFAGWDPFRGEKPGETPILGV
jgi:hypothetical protein